MSEKRIISLFWKDLLLFFRGRKKIRKKVQILYFSFVAIFAFFSAYVYKLINLNAGLFIVNVTFFMYLIISFLFELKNVVFAEEDMKMLSRFPVPKKEYIASKILLLIVFSLIFGLITGLFHLSGILSLNITVHYPTALVISLVFNSFFSMGFALIVYLALLKTLGSQTGKNIIVKLQLSLGAVFGILFSLLPEMEPLISKINSPSFFADPFTFMLPVAWFSRYATKPDINNFTVSLLIIALFFLLALIIGFPKLDINTQKQQAKMKDWSKMIPIRSRVKKALHFLIISHLTRSSVSQRTIIAPLLINLVILVIWSFNKSKVDIFSFGVWTTIFLSIIAYLTLHLSESYRAKWILLKSPLPKPKIMLTALNAAFIYMLIPYSGFLIVLFILKGISLSIISISVAYGLSAGFLFLHMLYWSNPKFLFSRPGFERGVNSIKELVVSFIILPSVGLAFNFFWQQEKSLIPKFVILFLILDIIATRITLLRRPA